jgi:hypothetical protein
MEFSALFQGAAACENFRRFQTENKAVDSSLINSEYRLLLLDPLLQGNDLSFSGSADDSSCDAGVVGGKDVDFDTVV